MRDKTLGWMLSLPMQQEGSQFAIFLKELESYNSDTKQAAKKVGTSRLSLIISYEQLSQSVLLQDYSRE